MAAKTGNCKTEKYTISNLYKKLAKEEINDHYPLQRAAGQWDSIVRSKLISDILQGNSIPAIIICEQIVQREVDGETEESVVRYLIDGKQRCDTIRKYRDDGFPVRTKGLIRHSTRYPVPAVDDEGEPLYDDKGNRVFMPVDYDFAGNRYSGLPPELQEAYDGYTVNVVVYQNCTDDDIAYHIDRYNNGRPMNAAQKGVLKMDPVIMATVNNIANKPFFQMGAYGKSDKKLGKIDRVVMESVMACYHFDDWKQSFSAMTEYLRKNSSIEEFMKFGELVDKLEDIAKNNDAVASVFNVRNSYLFFALFNRFVESGREDYERFAGFLNELIDGLGDRDIHGNGNTYNVLSKKQSKLKSVAEVRLGILEELMWGYLG